MLATFVLASLRHLSKRAAKDGLTYLTVRYSFLRIFVVVVLALVLVDWLADRRAHTSIPNATPG